jgi:hypothetical protein
LYGYNVEIVVERKRSECQVEYWVEGNGSKPARTKTLRIHLGGNVRVFEFAYD